MDRAYSTNAESRIVYRILVGKLEGSRLLGRPRRTWLDNIKMDRREREGGMVETELIRGPVEGSSESSNQPSGFMKSWQVVE
jgi:hypothetical protein